LRRLMALESRRRDKEQMIQVVYQPATSELLKELVAVVYGPLAKVYRAANVSDYVMDLSSFITDLINVVERLDQEQAAQHSAGYTAAQVLPSASSKNPLEPFVSLLERHQQPFYHFVHRVYSRDKDGLFRQLAGWMSKLQHFMRAGLMPPLDLQVLIDNEIRLSEHNMLKEDIEDLSKYRLELKARRKEKMRDKLARGGSQHWDEEEMNLVLGDLGMDDLTAEDAIGADYDIGDRYEDEEELEEELGGGGVILGQQTAIRKWRHSWVGHKKRGSMAKQSSDVQEPNLRILGRLAGRFGQEVISRLRKH